MQINLSAILCLVAACYGLYTLVKHQSIASKAITTDASAALPIIIGVLAWITASFVFFVDNTGLDSKIEIQRLAMVISWAWLAYRA